MTTRNDATESFTNLDKVIAEYLQAIEAGQVPNRQELLDRHPELAESLRVFFADFDRVDLDAAPLRLAGDAGCVMSAFTANVSSSGPNGLATIRYFGDYELLEEIAHGGMGVVYKARQASLNRIVALKMILKGMLATPIDVARFRAEAESAAALDHPHIVPIHEVGEHEGQQYFAMRYVEGTTLASVPRQSARAEVGRLLDVARAVHFAHQRGILHRDLKPSNVLVDPAGTAFVTDFGLAKRTGADSSLTETGQPVGTPRYMAPEQAAGRKDLTVRVDVYSLGAMLYERLTGRPPFLGDNLMEVLRLVRETDPPRPSSILPEINRDLETICLKCLEKDSGRRYASAEALAEDLEHWLKGEPIAARPVGRLERAWLWSRRNPALATAGGLAAAGLVAVAVISSIAASLAQARAKDAIAARDTSEGITARSLLRPLNPEGDGPFNSDGFGPGPVKAGLTEPETDALWELAETQDERLRMRFLDEATRDPLTTRQLRGRSEPALIAAVGLDSSRRDRASKLLAVRIHEQELTLEHKADAALVSLANEDALGTNALECINIILNDSDEPGRETTIKNMLDSIGYVASRAEPRVRAHLLIELGNSWPKYLGSVISGMAERLEPAEVSRILADTHAIRDYPDAISLYLRLLARTSPETFASGLASIAKELGPTNNAKACEKALCSLVEQFPLGNDGDSGPQMADEIANLIDRVPPAVTLRLLSSSFSVDRANGFHRNVRLWGELSIVLANGLIAQAKRLPSDEAAKVCGQAAQSLGSVIEKEKNALARCNLSLALTIVASHAEPSEAARVCSQAARVLTAAFEKEEDGPARRSLAYALASLSVRLTQGEAVKIIRLTTAAMQYDWVYDGEEKNTFRNLLTGTLLPVDADRAAQVLVAAIRQETNGVARQWQFAGLALVAAKMAPNDAARICGPVFHGLVNHLMLGSEDFPFRGYGDPYIADCVKAVAKCLDQPQAVQWARTLADALRRTADKEEHRGIAKGLDTGSDERAFDSGIHQEIATGLASVAERMPPAQAARLLIESMEQENDAESCRILSTSLATIAAQMKINESAPILDHAAMVIIGAIDQWRDTTERQEPKLGQVRIERQKLAIVLVAVAVRMAPGEASKLFDYVTRVFIDSLKRREIVSFSCALDNTLTIADMMAELHKQAAEKLCDRVVAELIMIPERYERMGQVYADKLEPLARRMDPISADRACADEIRLLLKHFSPESELISILLPHIRSREANNLAREQASLLCADNEVALDRLDYVLSHTGRPRPSDQPSKSITGLVRPFMQALSCRLTTQELVELLKMPTCIGKARRVVLSHLSNIHGRRFTNHWEFVRFAREKGLQLDLTTPPRRPNRQESIKRMLAILDGKA